MSAMLSPDPIRRARRARWTARAALLALAALAGCGGARKASVESPAPDPGEAARPSGLGPLAILIEPPPPPVLRPFSVNPTVAVAARPGVAFAPLSDATAYAAARRRMAHGQWPDARPEAFVDALADDGPGPVLRSALAPSPLRPGYHGLRIAIAPPAGSPPPLAVVVVEARRALTGPARVALSALAAAPDGPPRVALLVAGERPVWACPPTPRADVDRWRMAVDALDLAGPADVPRALAAARARLPSGGVVVLLGEGPARDPAGHPVARVAPDAPPTALIDAARRRLWADDVRVELSLDARRVERYRLVGFDGGGAGGPGGALWAGRPTAALIEVLLVDGGGEAGEALGVARIRGRAADGSTRVVTAAVDPPRTPDPRAARAGLAAAVAEKLRGAWWARAMGWAALAERARVIEPRGGPLGWWIERAMALDRRPDRFVEHGPVEAMDPHAVPVLRGSP